MNMTDEKRPLEERDREHLIYALDTAYTNQEPNGAMIYIFDDFEITKAQRNEIILASDYKNDDKLVSMLTLFG